MVCVCVCVDCVNVYVMFMPLRQSQQSPELDILCVNGKCAAHIVSTECVNLNDPPNGPLLHTPAELWALGWDGTEMLPSGGSVIIISITRAAKSTRSGAAVCGTSHNRYI